MLKALRVAALLVMPATAFAHGGGGHGGGHFGGADVGAFHSLGFHNGFNDGHFGRFGQPAGPGVRRHQGAFRITRPRPRVCRALPFGNTSNRN